MELARKVGGAVPGAPRSPGWRRPALPGGRTWVGAALLAVALIILLIARSRDAGPTYAGQSLRHWLGEMASADYQVHLRAEAALGSLGTEALPELVRVVETREGVVASSARRLWQRWFPNRPARPSAEALRMAATRLLRRLGPAAAPAAPALVRMIEAGSDAATREAEAALRQIGPPAAAPLVNSLRHGNPTAQRRILHMLTSCDPDGFGRELTNLVAQVVRFGTAADAETRQQAVTVVGALRGDTRQAVAFLTQRLDDDNLQVRCAAAAWLGAIGPAAAPATTRLATLLETGNTHERLAAARALWEVNRETTLTVPVLTGLLAESGSRSGAAMVLGELGALAAPAVPAMLAALAEERTHRPSRTPSMIAVALGKAGPAALPGLIELAGHTEADVRVNAAFALRGHGAAAAAAVPALRAMLYSEDAEERMSAANTLAAIGPAARTAEPDLIHLATATSGDVIVGHVASAAREALGRIRGSAADESSPLDPRQPHGQAAPRRPRRGGHPSQSRAKPRLEPSSPT